MFRSNQNGSSLQQQTEARRLKRKDEVLQSVDTGFQTQLRNMNKVQSSQNSALQSHRNNNLEDTNKPNISQSINSNQQTSQPQKQSQQRPATSKLGQQQNYRPVQTTSQTRKSQKMNLQGSVQKQSQIRKHSVEQSSPMFRGGAGVSGQANLMTGSFTQNPTNNSLSRDFSSNTRKLNSNNNVNQVVQNKADLSQQQYFSATSASKEKVTKLNKNFDIQDVMTQQEIDEYQIQLDQIPLLKRHFTHIAQTSTAIQVAWIKVSNTEQFRQIYKGKAHKCIITDLMPRTNYRFRVAPILITDNENDQEGNKQIIDQGDWSEISNISTKDNQSFTCSMDDQTAQCAQIQEKGRQKYLSFEKAGTVFASYGYSFGEHLWQLKTSYSQTSQSMNGNPLQSIYNTSSQVPSDQSGIMIVGVMNKKFNNSKMIGSVINYSQLKGNIKIKILLDANKKRLTVFTPNNPNGEVFTDLPKDGQFYPAIQNKTKAQKNQLRVDFKFELAVPKDKSQIFHINYSSSEEYDKLSQECDDNQTYTLEDDHYQDHVSKHQSDQFSSTPMSNKGGISAVQENYKQDPLNTSDMIYNKDLNHSSMDDTEQEETMDFNRQIQLELQYG
eukprot:403349764